MKRKRICLVTNWYPTEDNPHQGLFFREQALALADYYDFIVLHHHFDDDIKAEKAELSKGKSEYNITEYMADICRSVKMIKKFEKKNLDYREYLFQKICEQFPFETIDVFYSVAGQTEGELTAKYATHYDKPYVISEHGPFPWVGTVLSEANKNAIENANLFLAISNDKIRQVLMQGVKLPTIKYVGNMVDDELFTYVESKNEIKTFITVGANSFYKNYDMLIDTFNSLSEKTDTPFRLRVVGYRANEGYSQEATELENKFKESRFWESVDLIPTVPHEKMPELFAGADAFVMTSIQEGQPVSAMEAGCCGLPLFVTRCGGVEDYVDDGIGRVVGILDSDKLADHLKNYLEGNTTYDPDTVRRSICRRFGRKAFVENMVEAFESVIKGKQN